MMQTHKVGTLYSLVAFTLLLFVAPACTKKKEPSHEVLELDKRLTTAEESMVQLEAKIKKTPVSNQGLIVDLNNEKELSKARIERLKMQLDSLDHEFASKRVPGGAPAPAAGGGGHH